MIPFDYLVNKFKIKANGCLHLGSNTGQEAQTYKQYGIKPVIWVEALPDIFEGLKRHLIEVDCMEDAICLRACISDVDGKEVNFNIANNDSQSSSYLELGEHQVIHPTVKYIGIQKMITTRVDTLLKDYDLSFFDLLNVDVQGVELECLQGMGKLLNQFKYAIIEINKQETYRGGAFVNQIDKYMESFDFVRAETGQWVADCWTDGFYCKRELL